MDKIKPQEKWKKSFSGIHHSRSTEEKFWEKVEIKGKDECWLWQGCIDRCGYGKFEDTVSHRISWKLTYGNIPPKMYVCHKCDNPPCVNPNHLFLGAQIDNMRDMVAKGRSYDRCGEKNPKVKLKNEDVENIIALYADGHKQKEIGARYGVAGAVVSGIVLGKNWKQIYRNVIADHPFIALKLFLRVRTY